MASSHAVLRKFYARDSWESYSRELEQYFEVNHVVNDDERVAVLLTVLSPSVYKVLRDSCHPALPRLKTYAELSELMKIHHSPQPSVFKQRVEFYRATQAPNESVSEWLGRVMRLATACDFGSQLDSALRDNFVSGLANRRVVRRLCEEYRSATLADLVDMAEKYAPLYSTEVNILDLPDEVWSQIILSMTARERIPLGFSCRKLKTLVFETRELLRYLDFSKKACLTTMAHIQQYFNNKNACRHVLTINARYVKCMKPGDLLNHSIGKAINLVEVNIHGTRFEDMWELYTFLEPLLHLEKLSFDWPKTVESDTSIRREFLHQPFSKVTYLSVDLGKSALAVLTSSLALCRQLKELYIDAMDYWDVVPDVNQWNSEIGQLTNLELVHYHGYRAVETKEELASVLPDPERWMDFQLRGPHNSWEFYIERDVEVCAELLQSERRQDFLHTGPWNNFNFRWAQLRPGCLLKEVLRITHQDVPEDLCCLPIPERNELHLLNIKEAKLLLKNPRYQVSHLYMQHHILERDCDVHLLASAFPNLSELVLYGVTKDLRTLPRDQRFQRCLSKRCSPGERERQDDSANLHSSFGMLVENTPHLRHLTLNPKGENIYDWDSAALRLISGWKNLETLHITNVPCYQEFLTEISKGCKNLRKFHFNNSGVRLEDVVKVASFRMLEHCRNLRDVTIDRSDIDQVHIFSMLAENLELEKVKLINYWIAHPGPPWISGLENLIRRCEKLTTVICYTRFETEDDKSEAVYAVRRMKGEFRRPDFEMKVICEMIERLGDKVIIGTFYEDRPLNEPFSL